jgi:hypothetical protein
MGPPLQKINYLYDRSLVLGGFKNLQAERIYGKRYKLPVWRQLGIKPLKNGILR